MDMFFDKAMVRQKLQEWGKTLADYSLPGWEDFPALPLYMDQVIYLLNGYLSPVPVHPEEDPIVTPAMINNYVKLKIVPAPVKKRYDRLHLAYLVMVCVLKQTMNTGDIKRLLPADLPEDAVRSLYAAFVKTVDEIKGSFCESVRQAARPVLEKDGLPVTQLVFRCAVAGNLYKQAAVHLVSLQGQGEKPGES